MRIAKIKRKTSETNIEAYINLDGTGNYQIDSGIPFLDHMLAQISRHGIIDINIKSTGDIDVDFHHTVEDIGIVLGELICTALGDKKGIARYGEASIPLNESLSSTVIDISGRPFMVYNVGISKGKIGSFDTELLEEFFHALSNHMRATIHINLIYGTNLHHIAETVFKSFARALRAAVSLDQRVKDIPSTKGSL